MSALLVVTLALVASAGETEPVVDTAAPDALLEDAIVDDGEAQNGTAEAGAEESDAATDTQPNDEPETDETVTPATPGETDNALAPAAPVVDERSPDGKGIGVSPSPARPAHDDATRVDSERAPVVEDDARALTVDAVATVLAVPATSGLGSLHTPFVGARAGFGWPARAPGPLTLAWGIDGALLAGGFGSGTSVVRTDRAALAGLARAFVGPRIGGAWFSLLPFAMVQGAVIGGATLVRVDESAAVRPLAAAGLYAGVGLSLGLGRFTFAVETGAGFLGLNPSTQGTLALGWRF
jgi:hypothetical protein